MPLSVFSFHSFYEQQKHAITANTRLISMWLLAKNRVEIGKKSLFYYNIAILRRGGNISTLQLFVKINNQSALPDRIVNFKEILQSQGEKFPEVLKGWKKEVRDKAVSNTAFLYVLHLSHGKEGAQKNSYLFLSLRTLGHIKQAFMSLIALKKWKGFVNWIAQKSQWLLQY